MGKSRVLVTGGTGFLGKFVVPLLREKFEVDVLSRSGKSEVKGDLTQWDAGLDLKSLKSKKYDIFLHMAGLYDLKAPQVECNQHNVSATGTALKIANALGVKSFINTSTVAAAINYPLRSVRPYDRRLDKPFPDAYSESKALAEELITNWANSQTMNKINLRLGVLVGDTQAGLIERIDGPYCAMEAFRRLRVVIETLPTALPLPGKKENRLPIVPVDVAAQAVVKFCEWSQSQNSGNYQSFHITPTEGVGIEALYISALQGLGISHRGVRLIDSIAESFVLKVSEMVAKLPKEELHYLMNFPIYDNSSTREVLGERWCPEFKEYEQTLWRGYENYISHRRD